MVQHRPGAYRANADPYAASNRPVPPVEGDFGFDLDLGKLIAYTGSAWVDVDGTPV